MIKKEPPQNAATPDDLRWRLQILEEKFEYQDQTIDALNDVIIDQQAQINALEDQIRRFQAMLAAIDDNPGSGEEPPPPHY